MMDNQYDEYRNRMVRLIGELKKDLPGPLEGFSILHKQAMTDGVLGKKYKELIAIGIAICTGCEGCITFHVHDAMKAGATSEEIVETIGVAILMGGDPALMRGLEALEAIGQVEVEDIYMKSEQNLKAEV
jgi:AhpD family alkylhydroperoxidase